MSAIRIALLEDNPIDSLTIQMMLAEPITEEHQFVLVGVFERLSPLLLFLETNKVDIIIADIFMNYKAVGLELADELKKRSIKILFVSNTQDKAIFDEVQRRTHARFVGKPINMFTLHSSLLSIYEEEQRAKKYAIVDKQYLYLSGTGGQQEQVLFDDILYIESDGNYSLIFTTNKKYALKKSLVTLVENELADSFLRIHKRYIVNKVQIRAISESVVKIGDQLSLPIGKTYRKALSGFSKKY
ncbi:LytR/AlgR family response regulator transcription factor [Fibrella aquatica]|jgi:DNA-binding LytR/AlgR family response regulator|uniref:LytR/AlgR family response regulator transcription factor n=1 Tax=Fibrella aquatica TaxID=3242487 RepID=UPI003520DD82